MARRATSTPLKLASALPGWDALLLILLIVALLRIDSLAAAAVLPTLRQDVLSHPLLGGLLPAAGIAAMGERSPWPGEPVGLLLIALALGFAFAYQLPADFLRAIEVADGIGYKIEGRKILSDAADIYLRYVRQVTDPNEMDALFREALAWRLAVDLAIPITQSNSTLELMRQGYGAAVGKARAVDAIEDWPEEMPDGSWIAERV